MNKVSFLQEGAAELNGRLSGTFVSLREGEISRPLYVRSVLDTDMKKGTIILSGTAVGDTGKQWVPFTEEIDESSLDYYPPIPGMRNLNKYALYYDIVPLRHRYRGLRREQLRVVTHGAGKDPLYDSAEFQYALFNPKFLNVAVAIELVTKNKHNGIAFSNKFALMRKEGLKHLVFAYKCKLIGLYSPNDNSAVLPTTAHHLADELSSYINCIKAPE